MTGLRFHLTLATGETLSSVRIYGTAGEIGCNVADYLPRYQRQRERLSLLFVREQIDLASKGRRLRIYEPAPGHARVYVGSSAEGRDVPLAGACVEMAAAGEAEATEGARQ